MTLTQDELGSIMQTITAKLSVSIPDSLKKVILYGSYARGDYSDYSDVDVMVLVDSDQPESCFAYIEPDVNVMSLEHLVLITCLFQNYNHFYYAMNCTSFFKNVESEGVVYYDSERKN